jgi:hypothetical protein
LRYFRIWTLPYNPPKHKEKENVALFEKLQGWKHVEISRSKLHEDCLHIPNFPSYNSFRSIFLCKNVILSKIRITALATNVTTPNIATKRSSLRENLTLIPETLEKLTREARAIERYPFHRWLYCKASSLFSLGNLLELLMNLVPVLYCSVRSFFFIVDCFRSVRSSEK